MARSKCIEEISKTDFNKRIVRNMKKIMDKKSSKQNVVASKLGLCPSALCRYMNENRCPSLYLIYKFCQYFNVKVDTLLKEDVE